MLSQTKEQVNLPSPGSKMLVVQPAFKITVSGLPARCTCKALTSCLARGGSPDTPELSVGYAGGALQTRRLLRRLGDGGLGYQQMSMSNHGRPRGKPEKAQTRGSPRVLVRQTRASERWAGGVGVDTWSLDPLSFLLGEPPS